MPYDQCVKDSSSGWTQRRHARKKAIRDACMLEARGLQKEIITRTRITHNLNILKQARSARQQCRVLHMRLPTRADALYLPPFLLLQLSSSFFALLVTSWLSSGRVVVGNAIVQVLARVVGYEGAPRGSPLS